MIRASAPSSAWQSTSISSVGEAIPLDLEDFSLSKIFPKTQRPQEEGCAKVSSRLNGLTDLRLTFFISRVQNRGASRCCGL